MTLRPPRRRQTFFIIDACTENFLRFEYFSYLSRRPCVSTSSEKSIPCFSQHGRSWLWSTKIVSRREGFTSVEQTATCDRDGAAEALPLDLFRSEHTQLNTQPCGRSVHDADAHQQLCQTHVQSYDWSHPFN